MDDLEEKELTRPKGQTHKLWLAAGAGHLLRLCFLGMVYGKFKCEIYRVDIHIVYSESVIDAEKILRKKAGFGHDGITDEWQGGYIQQGSQFAMLIMPCKNILRNIHHETLHITMSIFDRVGIPHTIETDEAFCYLSDWIFDKTVSFLRKKAISI